jgi:dinuclear metal center YbgI/SA1388 family protein
VRRRAILDEVPQGGVGGAPGSSTYIESVVQFLDDLLDVSAFPDYPGAQNGLQVEGSFQIQRVGAAVDASVATIEAAAAQSVDLLFVHHGLYWDGLRPLTGRSFRRVAPLIRANIALYSAHLPLDAHPDVGNAAGLIRAMGLEPDGPFGRFEGVHVGFQTRVAEAREDLLRRIQIAVGGPTRLVPGGPEVSSRVGVVTGGGGSTVREAAELGLDTLVTGEGAYHCDVDARELGVNVVYAGHYETETFGVRAVAARLAEEFAVETVFLDFPPAR